MSYQRRGRLWIPEAPHLWTHRPRFRVASLRGPTHRLEGVFQEISLIHARTGDVVKRLGPFRNLILDVGLDLCLTSTSTLLFSPTSNQGVLWFCRVGTGSSTPAGSQTALDNQIGATTNQGGFGQPTALASGNEYWFARATRVFGTGEANGNLTEIGFGNTTSGNLFNRQLILDALGDPTTLVKTNEFQLRVVFELRLYLPLGDDVYDAEIDGSTQSVTGRVGLFNNWNIAVLSPLLTNANAISTTLHRSDQTFGVEGVAPGGFGTGAVHNRTDLITAAYTPGSFSRDVTHIWGPALANEAMGYSILHFTGTANSARPYKIQFPAVSKTNDDRFVAETVINVERHTP